MDLTFDRMAKEHAVEVMDIFNYYVENSFAAYPEAKLPYEFYSVFLEMTKNYPAFAIRKGGSERIIGFCFLRAYHPLPAFRETAELTCFLERGETGKGTGKEALRALEEEGRKMGIRRLLVNISAENEGSIRFHRRNGFTECGRFHGIGKKRGKVFDVVWMEKELA